MINYILITWLVTVNGFYTFPLVVYPSLEECVEARDFVKDTEHGIHTLCLPEPILNQLLGKE